MEVVYRIWLLKFGKFSLLLNQLIKENFKAGWIFIRPFVILLNHFLDEFPMVQLQDRNFLILNRLIDHTYRRRNLSRRALPFHLCTRKIKSNGSDYY